MRGWTCKKKVAANAISNDTKLDIVLEFQENLHTSSGQAAPLIDVSHSSIARRLNETDIVLISIHIK